MPKFDVTQKIGGIPYVRYTCPGCKHEHSVNGKRWNWNGDVDKPTLSPSVRHYYTRPDGTEVTTCHYHIKAGMIEFCDDCQHDLSSRTVELPNCYGT